MNEISHAKVMQIAYLGCSFGPHSFLFSVVKQRRGEAASLGRGNLTFAAVRGLLHEYGAMLRDGTTKSQAAAG